MQKPREDTGLPGVKGSVGAESDQETGCAWWKKQ